MENGPVLAVSADGVSSAEFAAVWPGPWLSPAAAARRLADDAPHPAHVLVAGPDPAATAEVLAGLERAGYTGALSVLISQAGTIRAERTVRQLQTALDSIPAPIFSKDADGVYGACNRAFEAYVGLPREKIIGRTVHEMWEPDLATVYAQADQALLAAGGDQIYDAQVRYADGSVHDVTFHKGVFTGDDGTPQGLAGAILDITERRALEERLRVLAASDPLTGAANRSLFTRRLDEAAAHERGHPPTVLLIDLDDFKIVNDTLGHDVGDRFLVAVAERLRDAVRDTDTVARLGGDEFAVLLEDLPADEVEPQVRRILAALDQPIEAAGHPLIARASIGVAHGGSGPDLLRNADIALYVAKDAGKGGYARYRPGMTARVLEQAALLDGLRQAVADDEFEVAYQPMLRLADGAVTGVEALVRWRHPTRGAISPVDFIPVAERSGLIVPLGEWVLAQACRDGSWWPATYVNTSARQLRAPGFATHLHRLLDESGLPPGRLVIEVSTAVLTGDEIAIRALHEIRALGVRVALDDVGGNGSALAVLAGAPVDIIKLDRALVAEVVTSERHAAVAGAIAQLAGTLGIRAVAKGVESAAQARRLSALGYREAQGFHLARPAVINRSISTPVKIN